MKGRTLPLILKTEGRFIQMAVWSKSTSWNHQQYLLCRFHLQRKLHQERVLSTLRDLILDSRLIWAQNSLIIHTCTQKDSHLYFRIHTCVCKCTHKCIPFHIHVNKIQIQKKVLNMYFWSSHICFPFKTAAPANTNRFLCMDRCAFVCGFFETPLVVTRFVLVIFSIDSQSDVSSILSQSHGHTPTRVWFLEFMT